jgi:formylglycine-generating enzyme required for sulfatase activity
VANLADLSLKPQLNLELENQELQKMFTAWFDRVTCNDSQAFTAPVGRFEPNAFGLCDVHGNVWEWCEDRYDESYYQHSPEGNSPGPADGLQRVLRGGSFLSDAWLCRAAVRHQFAPANLVSDLGFRVVRER